MKPYAKQSKKLLDQTTHRAKNPRKHLNLDSYVNLYDKTVNLMLQREQSILNDIIHDYNVMTEMTINQIEEVIEDIEEDL